MLDAAVLLRPALTCLNSIWTGFTVALQALMMLLKPIDVALTPEMRYHCGSHPLEYRWVPHEHQTIYRSDLRLSEETQG